MRFSRFPLVGGLLCLAAVAAAQSAELPSRTAKPAKSDDKAQSCEIDGHKGIAISGGACMRISGYVSVGVTAGNVK